MDVLKVLAVSEGSSAVLIAGTWYWVLRQGSSYENWRTKASFAALILVSIAIFVQVMLAVFTQFRGSAGLRKLNRRLERVRSSCVAVVVLCNRVTLFLRAYARRTRERKRPRSCRCLVSRMKRPLLTTFVQESYVGTSVTVWQERQSGRVTSHLPPA
jgi:peptidoglycan biosynthesis protein MviN/MurJ (putative lipid II flippase)